MNTPLLRAQKWLDGPYDEKTKGEIRRLMKDDPKALSDAFFKDLSFGTGGMRGIMGVGTNRMNIYTIRKATQGLANYLKQTSKSPTSAFIGYDVRHNSKEFALETARVLAGNGIKVYLTKEFCPTPVVSFGCRHFGCQSAVMITASHNPPEYNGYKVYWGDGAQVVGPHDSGIMHEVNRVGSEIHLSPPDCPLIHYIGDELNRIFLAAVKKCQLRPDVASSNLKIIYTPLHGTGVHLIPQALHEWGYTNVHLVKKQSAPDGNFPFAPSPNPEEKGSLALGTEQLIHEKGDLLIATDPDADRVGVVCGNRAYQFSGNQIACLLIDHICKNVPLTPKSTFVKSIVTTELFRKIAKKHGCQCVDVLTGFKYIGEKIHTWEEHTGAHTFVFGAEESCGYLFGTFARDKDAISSACLIAEMASLAKKENISLVKRLYQLYQEFGVHREKLVNLKFSDSEEGMKQMNDLLQNLRKNPPMSMAGQKVIKTEDFSKGIDSLPKSDVLRFWLEDGTKIVIRPSGTEPKVKIYIEGVEKVSHDIESHIQKCDERLEKIHQFFKRA